MVEWRVVEAVIAMIVMMTMTKVVMVMAVQSGVWMCTYMQ